MKKIYFLILIFLPALLNGQTYSAAQVDSLKRELLAHKSEDSTRVNLLILVGYSDLSKNPDEAMLLTKQAWELSNKIKWQLGTLRALRQIGSILSNTGREKEGIEYYQLAIQEGEKMGDKNFLASIYNNIGMIYLNTGELGKALKSYTNVLREIDPEKSAILYAFANTNCGITYFRMGKNDSALACLNRSTEVAIKNNLTQVLVFNYTNTGIVLDNMGQFSKAVEEFKKGRKLAESIDDVASLCQSTIGLAEGTLFLKQYDLAEKYCNEALVWAKQMQSSQYQHEAWLMLSDIYKFKGNFKQALEAYKNHITFRDSLINDEKKSEIVRKELSFDYERKALKAKVESEKNDALSKAEIERQKLRNNAFMGVGVIVLLSGATGFVGYKRRRDLERKSIQTQNELQVNKTELRVLRLQMDPHFIFNSLNSVSDYMLKNDIETADRYLTRFARLMRQTLEQSASSEVTLEDDLNALRTYLDLEQLRLKGKMTYTLSVDENINSSAVLVPSLILQPFIENSIVHGIGPKEGIGIINIKISREGNLLNCMLEDDGVGRQQNASNSNHKSYGMQITQTRIDLLNKMHNSNGGIKLTDLHPGFRAEVKIPYIEDNV